MRRRLALALLAAAVLLMAVAAVGLVLAGAWRWTALQMALLALVAGLGLTLWVIWLHIDEHLLRLERLRGALVMLAGGTGGLPPPVGNDPELTRLQLTLADLLGRREMARQAPDSRLRAVLGAVGEGIVVITAQGRVSLVNASARALFGEGRAIVGTSIFDVLDRASVTAALAVAEAAGGNPCAVRLRTVADDALPATLVDLGDHNGVVLSLPATMTPGQIEHDLTLHDLPPPPPPLTPETPLADLPVLVYDSETTGLDVVQDRVLSLGAVRVHGGRIYRAVCLDSLVNPGQRIPPRSTAIHGISDATVASAPDFTAQWPALETLARDCVMIGHNIGFDIAVLGAEAARAGIAFQPPPSLDTLLLTAALRPDLEDLNLESVAGWLGVDAVGRHTALGDALVTAEIWVRLLPLLAEAGVATYGAALAFSERPKHVRAAQRRAGWG